MPTGVYFLSPFPFDYTSFSKKNTSIKLDNRQAQIVTIFPYRKRKDQAVETLISSDVIFKKKKRLRQYRIRTNS